LSFFNGSLFDGLLFEGLLFDGLLLTISLKKQSCTPKWPVAAFGYLLSVVLVTIATFSRVRFRDGS